MKKKIDILVAIGLVGIVTIMAGGCFRMLNYNPLEPTVKYVVGDEVIANRTYSIFTQKLTSPEPEIPQKEHYSASWEKVDFNGGNKVVKAVYTPIEYTITYVKNGAIVGGATYTIESETVAEPDFELVSDRDGYTLAWEDFELDGGDKTVNAVYALIEYKINYVVVCSSESMTEKFGTDLFNDFWRQSLWLEENGMTNHPYATSYTIEGESSDVLCGRLIDDVLIQKGSTIYNFVFDGYFTNAECTSPIGVMADGKTGGWFLERRHVTTGDITLYLKFNYTGSGAVSPW